MFIVIEGLDGVGKTTAAKLLAETLPGEFFRWLQSPYEQVLPLIWDNEAVSEASKHIAFLAAFRHMSDIVNTTAYRNKTVVTDRYYFCSFAMHAPLAALAGEAALEFNRVQLGFKKPDFAFYLALDESLRRQRLAARGEPLKHVEGLLDRNSNFYRQVPRNYEDMVESGEMIRIVIDDLSSEEVVHAMVRVLDSKAQ